MQSFPGIILQRAHSTPQNVACRFFKGATPDQEILTFSSLWEQASGLARHFQSIGLTGQRAILVCKSQKNFVLAFYACLLAGVIAVPTAPPRRQLLQSRLRLIVGDSGARAIISDADDFSSSEMEGVGEDLLLIDVRSLLGAQVDTIDTVEWTPMVPEPTDVAFLQYTSGSTGDPKGVAVSHGNLVSNCAAIQEAMSITPESRLFTALPLFHDMGLVGGVLQLMYSGCSAGFLSPAEFVQYPERWLRIISQFGITVSGGPNYMYDLASRAIADEDLEGIDLSTWSVAFCGAEPIRPDVVARFASRFSANGFRADAFYPCYGMAESTLLITGVHVGSAPSIGRYEGREVVGCGVPRLDTRVEIVDPETSRRSPEGEIGEIWVKGSSVAQGYWKRPELTERVFNASIHGGEAGFLRTGDLGFFANGQLYVTGRLKDLIIINGRKYAPQDIEAECEKSHAALQNAGGAAFSVSESGAERLVVVFELKRTWFRRQEHWPEVMDSMRSGVSAECGLPVSDIVLIAPGTLPRTSSGKVRRSQCQTEYLAGTFQCSA